MPVPRPAQLLRALLAIVAPQDCCVCAQGLFDSDSPICERCMRAVVRFGSHRCGKCGVGLPEGSLDVCPDCIAGGSRLLFSLAVGPYAPPLSDMLRALKFGGRKDVATMLAVQLSELILTDGRATEGWTVVPVPLSPASLARRGYNQAEVLAELVSRATGLPLDTKVLRKNRETQDQATLSRLYRLSNLRGAFDARADLAKGGRFLLIDDITTTGSTLEECAATLRAAGAVRVAGAVVAKSLKGRLADGPADQDESASV